MIMGMCIITISQNIKSQDETALARSCVLGLGMHSDRFGIRNM